MKYEYQPLRSGETRVLVLEPGHDKDPVRCHLNHVSLTDNPKFEAVSYVCGDPNVTRDVICSGKMIPIYVNLYSALEQLRCADSERILWADAVCINQEDLAERSKQVQLMGQIYSQADTVLIWLGNATMGIRNSFEAVKQLHTYLREYYGAHLGNDVELIVKQLTNPFTKKAALPENQISDIHKFDWASIFALLECPWFRRTWTLQECCKAQKAVLICGDNSLPFDQLFVSVNVLWQYVFFTDIMINYASNLAQSSALQLAYMGYYNLYWRLLVDPLKLSELLELLQLTSSRECSDAKDKIYAICGLANDVSADDLELIPDYTLSVEEVYKRFARWCILKKYNLECLSFAGNQHSTALSLPSWVPDWSHMPVLDKLASHTEIGAPYQASKNSSPHVLISPDDSDVLLIRGIIVDKIQELAITQEELFIFEQVQSAPSSINDHSRRGMQQYSFSKAQEAVARFGTDRTPAHALAEIVWIENCKYIASRGTGKMSPKRYEEFWRTTICDHTIHAQPAPRYFARTISQHLEFLDDLRQGNRKAPALYKTNIYDEETNRRRTMAVLWGDLADRRFCSTTGDKLGWVPKSTQEGDIICIFYGARVPFVLRPCKNGQYKLIGECYLHGTMYGQAMEMKDFKGQEFALC
jgi:hypothetical protein